VGDGQIATHLAKMALQLDYHISICDPRDHYCSSSAVAAIHYSHAMPDDAVYQIKDRKRTAVVVLAHDPRQDDLALMAALEADFFYIGALGSKRSALAREKRLQTLGFSSAQLARIHAPVGLNIGSKRPAEIAVSILAQITAVRNGIH
jgi:xanthine dehydrogenase accessory factor